VLGRDLAHVAGPDLDGRSDFLAQDRMRQADDGSVRDGRVLVQHVLDLAAVRKHRLARMTSHFPECGPLRMDYEKEGSLLPQQSPQHQGQAARAVHQQHAYDGDDGDDAGEEQRRLVNGVEVIRLLITA